MSASHGLVEMLDLYVSPPGASLERQHWLPADGSRGVRQHRPPGRRFSGPLYAARTAETMPATTWLRSLVVRCPQTTVYGRPVADAPQIAAQVFRTRVRIQRLTSSASNEFCDTTDSTEGS